MKALTIRTSFAAAVLLTIVASSADAKDKWIAIGTKHFNVVSNADEKDARQAVLKLEQFRAAFVALFGIHNESPVPINVIAFRNDGAFKPFKPLYNGKPSNVAGYFQRGEDENIIALNISAGEEQPFRIIFHEYTHLLTAYAQRDWPLWLKEGLAELYSTFEINVNKNEVLLGKPIGNHVLLLRQSKLIPLERLFQVKHDAVDYNERDRQGIFYAESWALMHYFVYGNKSARKPELVEFIKLYTSGMDISRAFAQAFKSDTASIEKELRKYVSNDTYSDIIYTFKTFEAEKDTTVRPLSDAEVQFYLGDLLLHTNRVDEAETFFKQSMALDPALPNAYEGLGFIAVHRRQYPQARDHFKEATSKGSQNYLAHYYYADALRSELMEGRRGSLDVVQPDLAKTIVSEVKTAIKLMPGFVPSYNLLGFMSLVSDEPLAQGTEAIRTGLRIEPQNHHLVLTLAQLQMRALDYQAAKKTLAPLLADGVDPRVKSSAMRLMEFAENSSATAKQNQHDTSDSPPEPAAAPRLKRKDASEPASPKQDDKVVGPIGTQSIRGVLVAIECGNGMVLAFKKGDTLLRFRVSDPASLEITSRDPDFKENIGCGAINLPAIIRFKNLVKKSDTYEGDAVAVEFIKQL